MSKGRLNSTVECLEFWLRNVEWTFEGQWGTLPMRVFSASDAGNYNRLFRCSDFPFEMAPSYGNFSRFFLRKQPGRPGLAHWRGPKAEAPAWKDVDEDEATGSFFSWEIAVWNERLNGNVPCVRRGWGKLKRVWAKRFSVLCFFKGVGIIWPACMICVGQHFTGAINDIVYFCWRRYDEPKGL